MDGDLSERVDQIRVRVLLSCTSSVVVQNKTIIVVKDSENRPTLGALEPGRYAIEAVGIDSDGARSCEIASGCVVASFEAGGKKTIFVELEELRTPRCGSTSDGGVEPDARTCAPSAERCNGQDDDCDGITDEVAGGTDNQATCGTCRVPCPQDLACVGGLCVPPIVDVAPGAAHTCALRETGEVYCWGVNTIGQLGNGTMTQSPVPVAVTGLTDAVQIGSGRFHSCALRRTGQVSCWGENMWKQLSTETELYRNTPTAIGGVGAVGASLGVGYFHTCVVTDIGGVLCWGWNGMGQLGRAFSGNGDVQAAVLPAAGLQNVVEVDGGFTFTCARYINGTVACLGSNEYGQLGDGTLTTRSTAALVKTSSGTALDDIIHIALGTDHACALQQGSEEGEGAVLCWGMNDFGAVGNGGVNSPIVTPTVNGINDAVELSAGYHTSCARRSDGRMMCWGNNDYGQLGIGSQAPSYTPTQVTPFNATSLFKRGSPDSHACAIRSDMAVMCWGANTSGQLGTGSTSSSPQTTPVRVSGI